MKLSAADPTDRAVQAAPGLLLELLGGLNRGLQGTTENPGKPRNLFGQGVHGRVAAFVKPCDGDLVVGSRPSAGNGAARDHDVGSSADQRPSVR